MKEIFLALKKFNKTKTKNRIHKSEKRIEMVFFTFVLFIYSYFDHCFVLVISKFSIPNVFL